MRYVTTTIPLLLGAVTAFHKGLNFGATLASGACRTTADWERAFRTIRSLPPAFTSVRVFASSDCNTLVEAVPAALNTGIKILVGVWTEDDAHFGREKQALLDAIKQFPNWQDWMLATSVGSEDLYRKDTPAWTMAMKIYDVRSMLNSVGVTAMVGHVDTWTAWVDPANADVVKAVDFAGTDGYPYWQGATIPQSSEVFWNSIGNVQNAVNKIKPGLPVWSTETGWPVKGPNFGAAVANITNAQAYWRAVGCSSFEKLDSFYFQYSERAQDLDFSIMEVNDQPLFDLSCPGQKSSQGSALTIT